MLNTASAVEKIAHWIHSVNLNDIPEDVVSEAKRCIVDLVGVTVSARNNPLVRMVRQYVTATYQSGPAHIVGRAESVSPPGAALVNGTAGHVYDFDDTSYTGIMHGSTVAFPAALAATEYSNGDGKRLLEAYITGVEVTYMIAMLCTTKHYFRGWWSTATIGAFGAAAAAAKAMSLSHEKIVNALSLAGVQACGPKVIFGTDAKPYLAGRAAAIGAEAAILSKYGLCGPDRIFEDERGFITLMNNGVIASNEIDSLGGVWRLLDPGIFIKQYPVCSAAHAAIQICSKLIREHNIGYNDIGKIICEVPPTVAISLVYDNPKTVQEAQFSMQFSVGCIIRYGKLDITCLSNSLLNSPETREAMSKVEVKREDSLHLDGSPEGSRVYIELNDGDRISEYLSEPYGMPNNKMNDSSLYNKFHNCMENANIIDKDSEKLLECLLKLEKVNSLKFCLSDPFLEH